MNLRHFHSYLFFFVMHISSIAEANSYIQHSKDSVQSSKEIKLTGNKKKIWIDTDISIGKFSEDVDDALALIACLRSENIEIVGISVVEEVEYGKSIAEKILKWYEADIPVFQGASSKKGLGKETSATSALFKALKKDNLTILILGAATNIASTISLHPEMSPKIKEIIFCGGRKENMKFKLGKKEIAVDDSNFELDPESFIELLDADIPIVLSGYEASSSIFLSTKDLLPLKKSDKKHERWIFRKLKRWASLWRIILHSKKGFIPFDAATAAYLIAPDDCNCEANVPVQIEWKKNDAKSLLSSSKFKFYLEVSPDFKSERRVTYCHAMDKNFKEKLLKMILPKNINSINMLESKRNENR